MTYLTAELPLEKLDDESWAADKAARRARVASRNPSSNGEKSLYRQMAWCNTTTDNLGDLIRDVRKLAVDDTVDANHLKYFNADNKQVIMEKLRAAALFNNLNTAYLRLAKDFDYAAADEFEEEASDDVTLDETTAKKLDRVAKKHAKPDKPKLHPYMKGQQKKNQSVQNSQDCMPSQQSYGAFMQPQMMPSQQPQMFLPQQPQMPCQMMMHYDPRMMPQNVTNRHQFMFPHVPRYEASIHQFPPMQGVANVQQSNNTGRGRVINKAHCICKVCNGLGHWGGDPECPYTIQNPSTDGVTYQPTPPGTG